MARFATRLIVVGGPAAWNSAQAFRWSTSKASPKDCGALGVPPEYVSVVRAHRVALNRYRVSNRNWTYLSPSAGLVLPGERTGRFRVGGNQLLVTADGRSDISVACSQADPVHPLGGSYADPTHAG